MAANDPVAPEARKPHLSAEDAEQFASQIRPSWELLDFDGQIPDLGVPIESPLLKARAAGEPPPAGSKAASDTVIDGVPTFPVSGSNEPAPAQIKPMPIAAIGIPADDVPVDEDVPVDALPMPPPRIDLDSKKAPARKNTMIGGVGAEAAPQAAAAVAAPAQASPQAPEPVAPAPAGASRPAASSRRAITPATPPSSAASPSSPTSASSPAGRSRPGVTNADDDIEIPIAGPPKGLVLKLGIGAGALLVLGIGLKVLLGSSDQGSGTAPVETGKPTAAVVSAAPPATTSAAALPPPVVPPPVSVAATPSAVPSAAPVAPPKVDPPAPPPKADPPPAKTVAAPPPPAKTTPPAKTPPPPPKKGGGIIRETPF